MAQLYALRAFDACEREGWTDWRRASMLEGMARAAAAAGDDGRTREVLRAGARSVAAIAEEEDRALIAAQLATVPEP